MTIMKTFTGLRFDIANPTPEMVSVKDIAHHLSMICRFGGATPVHYSVAQHSVLVSYEAECIEKASGATRDKWLLAAMWGLFHDAAEAYVGDCVAPHKAMPSMRGYCQDERRCLAAIAMKIELPMVMPSSVHQADERVTWVEWRDVVGERYADGGLEPRPVLHANSEFLTIAQVPMPLCSLWFVDRYHDLRRMMRDTTCSEDDNVMRAIVDAGGPVTLKQLCKLLPDMRAKAVSAALKRASISGSARYIKKAKGGPGWVAK